MNDLIKKTFVATIGGTCANAALETGTFIYQEVAANFKVTGINFDWYYRDDTTNAIYAPNSPGRMAKIDVTVISDLNVLFIGAPSSSKGASANATVTEWFIQLFNPGFYRYSQTNLGNRLKIYATIQNMHANLISFIMSVSVNVELMPFG
jgi:hypothetical protein